MGSSGINIKSVILPTPTLVPDVEDAVDIIAGIGIPTFCVVLRDSSAKCWGQSIPSMTRVYLSSHHIADFQAKPVVGFPAKVSSIAVSLATCATDFDGNLFCRGNNRSGQLGLGQSLSVVPKDMGLAGAVGVSAGDHNVCVVLENEKAKCLGDNWYNELGNQTLSQGVNPAFVDVLDISDRIKNVYAGKNLFASTCALTETNRLFCWGSNHYGQTTNDKRGSNSALFADELAPVKREFADKEITTVDLYINIPTLVPLAQPVVEYSHGHYLGCGKESGGVWSCWGSAGDGELGTASNYNIVKPQPLAFSQDLNKVVAGIGVVCGIWKDESLKCWGDVHLLQNGLVNSPTPTTIDTKGKRIKDVFLSNYKGCALTTDNAIQCFGFSDTFAAAIEAFKFPTLVADVEMGRDHACARLANQDVYCWGLSNRYGQIGSGSFNESRITPRKIAGVKALSLAVGDNQTCVVNDQNRVLCWGLSYYNEPAPIKVAW